MANITNNNLTHNQDQMSTLLKPTQSSFQPLIKLTPISCEDLAFLQKKDSESESENEGKDLENTKSMKNLVIRNNSSNKDFLPKKASDFAKTSNRTRGQTVYDGNLNEKEKDPNLLLNPQKKQDMSLFNMLFKQKYKTWLHDFSPQVSLDKSSSDNNSNNIKLSNVKKEKDVNNEEGFIDIFSDMNVNSGNVSEDSNKISPSGKEKKVFDFIHIPDSIKSSFSSSKNQAKISMKENQQRKILNTEDPFESPLEISKILQKTPVFSDNIKNPKVIERTLVSNENPKHLKEKSPLFMEKSPLSKEKSPLFIEKSPLSREKNALLIEKSPLFIEKIENRPYLLPLTENTAPLYLERPSLTLDTLKERLTLDIEKAPLTDENPYHTKEFYELKEEDFMRRSNKGRTVYEPQIIPIQSASQIRKSILTEKKHVIRKDDEAIKICIELEDRLRDIFEQEFTKSSIRILESAVKILQELKAMVQNQSSVKQCYEYHEILEILEFVRKILGLGQKFLKYKWFSSKNMIKVKGNPSERLNIRSKKRTITIKTKPNSASLDKARKIKTSHEKATAKLMIKTEIPRFSMDKSCVLLEENKEFYLGNERRSESEVSIDKSGVLEQNNKRKTRFSLKNCKEMPCLKVLRSPKLDFDEDYKRKCLIIKEIENKTKTSLDLNEKNPISLEIPKENTSKDYKDEVVSQKSSRIIEKSEDSSLKKGNFSQKSPKNLKLELPHFQKPELENNLKMSSPGIFKRALQKPSITTKILEYGQFFLEEKREKDHDTKDIRHSPIYKYTKMKSVEVLSPVKKSPEEKKKKKLRMSIIGMVNSGTLPENLQNEQKVLLRKKKRHLSYQIKKEEFIIESLNLMKKSKEKQDIKEASSLKNSGKKENKGNLMINQIILKNIAENVSDTSQDNIKETSEKKARVGSCESIHLDYQANNYNDDEIDKARNNKFNNNNDNNATNDNDNEKNDESSDSSDEESMFFLEAGKYMKEYYSDSDLLKIESKWDSDYEHKDEIMINDFEFINLIGKGAYGRVYLVRRKLTDDLYAMKIINTMDNMNKNKLVSLQTESKIFDLVTSEYVVKALFKFKHDVFFCFVMEYMHGGDFNKLLQIYGRLDEKIVRFYIAELVLAIEHLHNVGVVHRDLKPDNILLDSKGHIKLTDFGLSDIAIATYAINKKTPTLSREEKFRKFIAKFNISDNLITAKIKYTIVGDFKNQKESLEDNLLSPCEIPGKKSIKKGLKNQHRIIGTPDYIAPEILNGVVGSLNNPSIDWWSLGVILFEFLIGVPPFTDDTVDKIFDNIMNLRVPWDEISIQEEGSLEIEEDKISFSAMDLMRKLLVLDPKERLEVNGIKKHKFFTGVDWKTLHQSQPPIVPEKINANVLDSTPTEKEMTFLDEFIKAARNEPGKLNSINRKEETEELHQNIRFDLLHLENQKIAKETLLKLKVCEDTQSKQGGGIETLTGVNDKYSFDFVVSPDGRVDKVFSSNEA